MYWITAHAEHIGGRREQQDRSIILANAAQQQYFAVVADGMGGHSGGALAAQAVVETAEHLWRGQGAKIHAQNLTAEAFLEHFCYQSHHSIQQVGAAHGIEPHSTCVALYLEQQQAYFTHLGDSRLYHLRKGQVERRSRDHSLVQMLVDLGRISEAEMGTHQDQGCLLKGLGGDSLLEGVECQTAQALVGDLFMLCSDGFWEYVQPVEVWQSVAALPAYRPAYLQQSAQQLVQQAATRGGKQGDNISLVLCVLK